MSGEQNTHIRHQRMQKLEPESWRRAEGLLAQHLSLEEAYAILDSEAASSRQAKAVSSSSSSASGGSSSSKRPQAPSQEVDPDIDPDTLDQIAEIDRACSAVKPPRPPSSIIVLDDSQDMDDDDDDDDEGAAGHSKKRRRDGLDSCEHASKRRAGTSIDLTNESREEEENDGDSPTAPTPASSSTPKPKPKPKPTPVLDLTDSQDEMDHGGQQESDTEEDHQDKTDLAWLPPAGELWLVVDGLERKENAKYTSLLQTTRTVVHRESPLTRVTGANMHLGDYCWVMPPPAGASHASPHAEDQGKEEVRSCRVYPCIIERKTLNDIISASASFEPKTGRESRAHRQERNLRRCPLRHCFFLLEGEVTGLTCSNMKPLCGEGDNEKYLSRPDVIATIEDLDSTTMGMLARNLGQPPDRRVLLLPTSETTTALVLAALSICASHAAHRGDQLFSEFDFQQRPQQASKELKELDELLRGGEVAEGFSGLVQRRFGSVAELEAAVALAIAGSKSSSSSSFSYSSSSSSSSSASSVPSSDALRGALLLCHLSHGGGNTTRSEGDEDDDEVSAAAFPEALKVYNLVCPPGLRCPASLVLAPQRLVAVEATEHFHLDMGLGAAQGCSMYRLEDRLAGQECFCRLRKIDPKNRRRSADLVVIRVSASQVLQGLAAAVEASPEASLYEIVRQTWHGVRRAFSPGLTSVVGACERGAGQIVVLVENVGHLRSKKGERKILADGIERAQASGSSRAVFGRELLVSSLQRVEVNLQFLTMLLMGHLGHDLGWQLLLPRSSIESKRMVWALMRMVYRESLMTKTA